MSLIPRKTESEVRQAPLRLPFQTAAGVAPAAFGGAQAGALADLAKGMEGLSREAQQIAIKIKIDDGEREANTMFNSFSEGIRGITLGVDAAEGVQERTPGYYESRGEGAVEGAPITKQSIEDLRQQILKDGISKLAIKMFDKASAARAEQEYLSVDKFTIGQRRVASDQVSEATINDAINEAAADPLNEVATSRALMRATNAIVDMSERNSWDDEVTAVKVAEATSAILKGVIVAAEPQNPTAALALYERYKGSIDGGLHASIENLLEVGTVLQTAQQEADAIMSVPGLSNSERRKLVRKLTGKVREETMRLVNNQIAYAAQDKVQLQQETRDITFTLMAEGEGNVTLATIKQTDPELWGEIVKDPSLRSEVLAMEKSYALGKQGYAPSGVSEASTLTQIAFISFSDLASTDPVPFKSTLSQGAYQVLLNNIAAARRATDTTGKITSAGERAMFSELEGIIQDMAPEWLRTGADKSDEDRKRTNRFVANIMTIVSKRAEGDDIPDNPEMRKIVGNLLKEFESKRLLGPLDVIFGTAGFGHTEGVVGEAADLSPEQIKRAQIKPEDISPRQDTFLRGMLTVLGVKPTDKLVGKIAFQEAIFDAEAKFTLIRSEMTDEQFTSGIVPFDPRVPHELFGAVEQSLRARNIPITQGLLERLVFLRLMVGEGEVPDEIRIAIDEALRNARREEEIPTPSLGR